MEMNDRKLDCYLHNVPALIAKVELIELELEELKEKISQMYFGMLKCIEQDKEDKDGSDIRKLSKEPDEFD